MATMTELGGKVAAAAAVRAVMPTFTAMGTTGSVKVTDEVVAGVPVVKVRVRVSTTWADNMEAEACQIRHTIRLHCQRELRLNAESDGVLTVWA